MSATVLGTTTACLLDAAALVATTPEDARVPRLLALIARCVGATSARVVVPGVGGFVPLASSRSAGNPSNSTIDAHLVRDALVHALSARTDDGQLVPVNNAAGVRLVALAASAMLSGRPRAVVECRGASLDATPDTLTTLQALCAMVALAVDASDRTPAITLVSGGIAHDLNNHLTAMNGLCEVILENEDLDADVREDLECVRSAGEQASLLTQQLLAYSGRQVLNRRVEGLDACVERALPRLRHLLGNDIRVEYVPSRESLSVDIDHDQVANILLMLAANARDAGASSIRLASARVRSLDDTHVAQLTVVDDGSGMSDDVQARAFEPFFTTRRRLGHVGLGLPAIAGALGQLGGTISITSRAGHGTTAEVCLPLVA